MTRRSLFKSLVVVAVAPQAWLKSRLDPVAVAIQTPQKLMFHKNAFALTFEGFDWKKAGFTIGAPRYAVLRPDLPIRVHGERCLGIPCTCGCEGARG